jgi:hypothetical protein
MVRNRTSTWPPHCPASLNIENISTERPQVIKTFYQQLGVRYTKFQSRNKKNLKNSKTNIILSKFNNSTSTNTDYEMNIISKNSKK